MDASRGWITSVGYSFHTLYLFCVALGLLLAPVLVRVYRSLTITCAGLGLLAAGSLLNGLLLHGPIQVLVAGRAAAGLGVGFVVFAGQRLLPPARGRWFDWFAAVLPAFGLMTIATATVWYGGVDWEGGFLFEGVLAVFGLACVVSLAPPPEPPVPPSVPVAAWPAFALAFGCTWYLMHWGQLNGWYADTTVLAVGGIGSAALTAALWLTWPRAEAAAVAESWPRLVLVMFAGLVQFSNASEAGVTGGLFVNLGIWQRAVLITPIAVGAAAGLVLGLVVGPRTRAGRPLTFVGLLVLAVGLGWAHRLSLDWPFWADLNTVEFHWFVAPQTWELGPARFLMGFGHGLMIYALTNCPSRDPARESRVRSLLPVAQFIGGGLGIGFLATMLIAGHQWQYSYAADRGSMQPDEVTDRLAQLRRAYAAAGDTNAARQAEVLMFRSVNYQADALLFSFIYALGAAASLVFAAGVVVWHVLDRLASPPPAP
jgi:hypothetical protein